MLIQSLYLIKLYFNLNDATISFKLSDEYSKNKSTNNKFPLKSFISAAIALKY